MAQAPPTLIAVLGPPEGRKRLTEATQVVIPNVRVVQVSQYLFAAASTLTELPPATSSTTRIEGRMTPAEWKRRFTRAIMDLTGAHPEDLLIEGARRALCDTDEDGAITICYKPFGEFCIRLSRFLQDEYDHPGYFFTALMRQWEQDGRPPTIITDVGPLEHEIKLIRGAGGQILTTIQPVLGADIYDSVWLRGAWCDLADAGIMLDDGDLTELVAVALNTLRADPARRIVLA